jgi:hypothetical protein
VGDGYDLDTPDDALMCEDAQGYVIPCDEADGLRIPIAEGQRAEANEGCPVPPPGIEPSVEDDEHRIERGDVAVVPAEPPPPPPGGMMVPTRAERRAFERQARRERRSRS